MARSYRSGIAAGMTVSASLALFWPLFRPAMARWGRPAAKGAVKGGLAAYELTRMRVAELGEHAQDLLAEAQIERAGERLHSESRERHE